MQDFRQNLRDFIVENFLFGQTQQPFTDDESLLAAGIIDSTGILELVMFVEERGGIIVADDELAPENLDSVSRLVAFVERKRTLVHG